MELLVNTEVLNLDNIPDAQIIMATIDGQRLILSKDQLFSRLGRRRKEKKKVNAKKTSPN